MSDPLLKVENLQVEFSVSDGGWPKKTKKLVAVEDVSFELASSETLGIVGESGCGKSTLARAILRLVQVSQGRVLLDGVDLMSLDPRALREKRQIAQMIFQDPLASLNPRMTVADIIAEPLQTFRPSLRRVDRQAQAMEMMRQVGLLSEHRNRYPHEFSGGQCQRIGIARALILRPKLLICDEPVSALDVSVQAQILNLLMELQRQFQLALIFIAHDLSVVRHMSHQVMVMYLGRVVELASKEQLYATPRHPYSQALLRAVPSLRREKLNHAMASTLLVGDVPSPLDPPSGCHFRTRCPYVIERCANEQPSLRSFRGGVARCLRLEEIFP